jgi:hypothetical protein
MKVQNSPFLFFSQVSRSGIERKGERKEKGGVTKNRHFFLGMIVPTRGSPPFSYGSFLLFCPRLIILDSIDILD